MSLSIRVPKVDPALAGAEIAAQQAQRVGTGMMIGLQAQQRPVHVEEVKHRTGDGAERHPGGGYGCPVVFAFCGLLVLASGAIVFKARETGGRRLRAA